MKNEDVASFLFKKKCYGKHKSKIDFQVKLYTPNFSLILDTVILMSSTWYKNMVQTWRHSHLVQSDELKVTSTWWRKNNLAVDNIIKGKKLRVHFIHGLV